MQISAQDFKATPAMIAMIVGAALLLLASLPILPWATATGFGQSTGITLDQTRSISWLLMALVAIVIGGAAVAYAFKVRPLTMAWIVAAIAAGLGLLLVIKVFLDIMSANAQAQSLNSLGGLLGSAGINSSVGIGPSLGLFLGLLGVVVAGVGAILAAVESGMVGSKKSSAPVGGYSGAPMGGPPPPMSPPPGGPPPSPPPGP